MTFLKRFSDNNVTTLTDAATIDIDMSLGAHFQVTLGGNRTLGNPTNASAVKEVWISVRQDATGGRTLAFSSDWIAVDSTVTVNPAVNSVTIVYATSRDFGAGVKWYYTVEHAAETGSGGSYSYHALGLHETTTQRLTEVLVGGLFFNPSDFGTPTVKLRLSGSYISVDAGSDARIYLYDMGPGTGAFSPLRRATVAVPFASIGAEVKVDQALTLSASPGVDMNQIHNVARVYEARMYLNTTDVGSSMKLTWAGFEIISS